MLVSPEAGSVAERRFRSPSREAQIILRAAFSRRVGHERLAVLTFDDGPHPTATRPLLRALTTLGVPATFFLVGESVVANPQICRELAAAGMELGNHSMHHRVLAELGYDEQRREIDGGAAAIEAATGTRPRFFRPPYGKFDPTTVAAARDAGTTMALWNVTADEWGGIDLARTVARLCARAWDPAIVLLHDFVAITPAAVEQVVRAYRRAGYAFVTLGDLAVRRSGEDLTAARPLRVRQ